MQGVRIPVRPGRLGRNGVQRDRGPLEPSGADREQTAPESRSGGAEATSSALQKRPGSLTSLMEGHSDSASLASRL